MKINMSLVRFIGAAVVVMALGALAGWYLFVSQQIDSTDARNDARGFGETVSFGGAIGSSLSNLLGGVVSEIVGGSEEERAQAPRLWPITKTPVAGLGFVGSTTALYFAERASGNVLTADPTTTKIERLTNTLVPQVHEAVFAADGSVILRSIGENGAITSFAAVMATNTSPAAGDTLKKLEGMYLPEGIISLSARSAPNEIFFILKEGEGAAGVVSNWAGGSRRRIFTSPLSDWKSVQLANGSRYIVQKAADNTIGYAFSVNSAGALEKIASGVGLSILPRPYGPGIIYSIVGTNSVSLYAKAAEMGSEIRLPIRTIAEKCVWAPGARLIAYCAVPQTSPRAGFLQGLFDGSLHTSDAWWRVDVSANTAEQLFTPDSSISLDVESPAVDANGTHIGFINRADKSLWMLRIQP